MIKPPKGVRESLALKLFLVLGGLILSAELLFTVRSIRQVERNLMSTTISFVSSFSKIVKESLRYDMMVRHHEDIKSTIESIGATSSIDKTRIFNSKGTIVFSSNPEEAGRHFEKSASPCVGCHEREGEPLPSLAEGKNWTTYRDPANRRMLSIFEPIYNEPACSSSPCHVHQPTEKILGVLTTDFDLQPVDSWVKARKIEIFSSVALFLSLSLVLLLLALWRLVLRPIKALSLGMETVATGDLSQQVSLPARDEMGRLADSFNRMTGELREARRKLKC